MDEWPVLLKVSEVAAILRVSRNLVYELIAEGELPVIRLGRIIRVPRDALERWIEREAGIAAPEETDHAGALYSPNRVESAKGVSHAGIYQAAQPRIVGSHGRTRP